MPGLSNNHINNNTHRNTNATTVAPPTMTNPYVQSRSIQSTLASLANETKTLREETRRLDSQRVALQERMKQQVQLQQQLDHEIRVGQGKLGTFHRERTMLVQEQKRLETQLEQERNDMQACATEYEGLLKREKERKIQFCKDISEANKEMGDLLKQQEEESFLQKITPVCHDLIKDAFEKATKNAATAAGGGGGGDNLAADMEKALAAFASAARNKDHAVAEKEQLQQKIEMLRDLALQGVGGAAGKNLSKDMLMSLEGVWQEDWQPEEEHGTSGMNKQQVLPSSLAAATFGSPVHMQLFYDQVNGQAQQQEQDATEDDADSFMPPPPPRHMQQTQQQQHHMAMEAHHEQ